MRTRLVQDDSCHWYAIPADQRAKFEEWVNTFGWGEHPYRYEGPDFEQYRLSMHPSNYTFVKLEEDK